MSNKSSVWTKKQGEYVILQLALWRKPEDIFNDLSAIDTKEKTGVDRLHSGVTLDRFIHRCTMVKPEQRAEAFLKWQSDFTDTQYADEKSRVKLLVSLVERLEKMESDDPEVISQVRLLMEQIRKERNTEADREALKQSGTRILLSDPNNVEIDVDTLEELIMLYRREVGGLHLLNWSLLSLTELDDMESALAQAKRERLERAITSEAEVSNIDPHDPPEEEQP